VQTWASDALRLKCALSFSGFDISVTTTPKSAGRLKVDARVLVASALDIAVEAAWLDSELGRKGPEAKVKPAIERLAWIFEHENRWTDGALQKEIEEKYNDIMTAVREFRTKSLV
jgi:hypothetical protein